MRSIRRASETFGDLPLAFNWSRAGYELGITRRFGTVFRERRYWFSENSVPDRILSRRFQTPTTVFSLGLAQGTALELAAAYQFVTGPWRTVIGATPGRGRQYQF